MRVYINDLVFDSEIDHIGVVMHDKGELYLAAKELDQLTPDGKMKHDTLIMVAMPTGFKESFVDMLKEKECVPQKENNEDTSK